MEVLSVVGATVNICLVPDVQIQRCKRIDKGITVLTGECLDLLAYHIDASVVTRIELEHHLPHVL